MRAKYRNILAWHPIWFKSRIARQTSSASLVEWLLILTIDLIEQGHEHLPAVVRLVEFLALIFHPFEGKDEWDGSRSGAGKASDGMCQDIAHMKRGFHFFDGDPIQSSAMFGW
jgi:hypothetical protein